MDVAWIQLGQTQKMYQAFSHSLKYMDFISKVRNHDQMGNYTANIRLDEDVLKTSFVFVFRRRLDQDEYVRLSLMSSEDVFKTSSRILGHTSSRSLAKMSSRRFEDVFKTSSRRFQDVLSS